MTFKLTSDRITPSLDYKIKELKKVPGRTYDFFVKQTPVRSGNARSKTKLKDEVIIAGYPYAQKLEDGYSQQAPDGMSKATLEYHQKQVDAILKRK